VVEILSENRDLKPYIREAERMLTQVDITRLPSYELGMEQGMQKGKEAGATQARLAVARNLLNVLGDDQIAETTGLSLEDIAKLRSDQCR
jgi:predicted transposase/invertase (TIGR01784 family)